MNHAQQFSQALTEAVARAAQAVVGIDGGRQSSATGIAWGSDLVVAPAHALERAEELGVVQGETRLAATLVGADPASDLALLRVNGTLAPLRRANLGELRAGEPVLALSHTARGTKARFGVVSLVGGELGLPNGVRVAPFVETDIPPARGLSGSAVVNLAGELLGVSSALLSRGSLALLPIATIERVVEAVLAHGRVRRARLGVGLERVSLPPAVASRRGQERGLIVLSVAPGSAAERAGLLLGDVLLAAGGRAIERVDDLMSRLGESAIDAPLEVELFRAGAEQTVSVVPEAR
jgi:S1-C subfamily serine protease